MAETLHHRVCPLCEACCGLEIRVREGRIAAIRGHEADSFSQGYICPKAVALKDLHEDPDRLRTPLVKRDGRFVAVGWDEAFAEIEARLPPLQAAHGRDALALVAGNPTVHKIGLLMGFARLAKAAGSRNVFSASTLDQMPKQLASGLMYGTMLSVAVPDIERCSHLLVLGANPLASNGSMWTVPDFRGKAKALLARGGKLVVVDPRRTETAVLASGHHFIRPGADAFLLAGMVHTLFDEGLVRTGRAGEWLLGVDAVQAAVQPFAPEAVAARCGIEAAAIRRLARELAAAPQAAVYGRLGTCTQEFGTLASWLIDVLNALTGNLDVPGGVLFPKAAALAQNTMGRPGQGRGVTTGRHASRVSGAPEVFGELPVTCLAEEIETAGPGQVRALVVVAANPVLSSPNGPRLAAALEQLDFMVSVDIYVNETSRHADVILPGLSPLEEFHYDIGFSQLAWRNHARASLPVFPAPAGQLSEWTALAQLASIAAGRGVLANADAADEAAFAEEARKLFGEQAPAVVEATAGLRGAQRRLEVALRTGPYGDGFGRQPEGLTLARIQQSAGGIDLGPLQPRLPELLRTPSGRVELAPPSCIADLGRAAADLQRPPAPLVIVGRRDVRSNNSWMHNLPVLAKGPERCTLMMHPDDARRLGLAEGAPARISANGRSVQAPVHLSADMMPGVVSLPHGWGHGLPGVQLAVAGERPGASLNDILDENARDPLSGNAVLGGVAVDVMPA